jgi:HlyD family secretion protein
MKIFTKMRVGVSVVVLFALLVGYGIYTSRNKAPNILTDVVKKKDLKQTVLATGQVTSETDLDLSFKTSGVVDRVFVKVGQVVKPGQILAQIDQKNELASITQARGAVAQAQANYQKVLDGASSEDIAVAQKAVDAAQVTLDNAKRTVTLMTNQQKVLVDNAYATLLNSNITAVPESGNEGTATVTVTGSYSSTKEGKYTIETYIYGTKGQRFNFNGLETGFGDVQETPVPMGNSGLSLSFSGNPKPYKDRWVITIPNIQASNYVTNLNAYKAALETQKKTLEDASAQVASSEAALVQAKASLDLKKSQARPAELNAAKAQILSAQGQLQAASANLENTVLRAPSAGTITSVDIKVGELTTAQKEVMILQDVGNLHIEANISEANIANIKVGQTVEVTLDAFGPDKRYVATVQAVDPASTVVSGVVNYKITATLEKDSNIKPGMTANMSILTAEKAGVLVIPVRAVVESGQERKVRIIKDIEKKTFEETVVTVGLEGDGGLVEVLSGLSEGQEVVTFVGK